MTYKDPPYEHTANTHGAEFIALINLWRKELFGNIYPVGAVYTSVISTDPANLFGGTWEAIATGRTLVGIDSGDADFDVAEETGGAKTHTLIESEIPAHRHTVSLRTGGTTGSYPLRSSGASIGVNTDSSLTGGGGPHNNVQPYFVVYIWKRTA